MFEHIIIITNIFLSLSISIILFGVIYLLIWVSNLGLHIEKLASYECGFYPFEDTRQMFRIRYYLIAILFIIFDIEIILLIPLVIFYPDLFFLYLNDSLITYQEFVVIMVFLLIISLGFAYEWMKAALYWE